MAAKGILVGAVLCGGRSERMGRDKALLELGGRPLLRRAVDALEGLCEEVLLAVGPVPRYEEFGRPWVLDRAAGLGPLAGLEASLAAAVERGAWAACVLGCDMPDVRGEHFERLLERLAAEDADVALASGPRGIEPLLGVYRSDVLGAVRASLERGERSLRSFHRDVRVTSLDLADEAALHNLNSPEDLVRARAEGRER